MNKRIVSILLCLLLIVGVAQPVAAQKPETEEARSLDLVITDTNSFLQFAQNCRLDSYSRDLYVILEADIDLADVDFSSIPHFSGIFDGQGHTVSGLQLATDGSAQGLFRYLTDTAVVQNLAVLGTVEPGGSRNLIGGIAGENSGSILNCSFTGVVSGGDYVGGIAGRNGVAGVIEGCSVAGELCGEHFVGGITGENLGVIRDCSNEAAINTTAVQNTVKISDINLDTLTNSEAVNTVTDIGGVAGTSSGVIRSCVNRADVGYQHMGYNIGGIAGTQVGYIVKCENYGKIYGRKEVGGIVGQMEPAAMVEFTEDALQSLQQQLETMGDMIDRTAYNASVGTAGLSSQIGALQQQSQVAQDAVAGLIPDRENPQLPDPDAILAAQSTLSNSLTSMNSSIRGMASSAQSTLNSVTEDLQVISGQINTMTQTISNAGENLGGSVIDVSDQDTPEDLTGKVEWCNNYGDVLADLNVGGITGAICVESDYDFSEDWELYGDLSLNFNGEVRAVLQNCENRGVVTGQKQNIGGIVGWQMAGLVKNSTNIGNVAGGNADHVGGISGRSTGFIRACNARCQVQGSTVAGGIAGSAGVVTDSLSLVQLVGVSEKVGAILGQHEARYGQEETPIAENFYLPAGEDPGAIDGISYDGIAQPMSQQEFQKLENLPNAFKSVLVEFVFPDETRQQIRLVPGGQLEAKDIPAVPEKEGYSGSWAGLAEADLSNVLFDMQFYTTYTGYRVTLESQQTRDNGLPLLLLEGSFTEKAELSIAQLDMTPALEKNEVLLAGWKVSANEPGDTAHLWCGADAEHVKLLVNGQETSYQADGSYLVFPLETVEAEIFLVQTPAFAWATVAILGGAALVLLLLAVVLRKKRKQKNTGLQPIA